MIDIGQCAKKCQNSQYQGSVFVREHPLFHFLHLPSKPCNIIKMLQCCIVNVELFLYQCRLTLFFQPFYFHDDRSVFHICSFQLLVVAFVANARCSQAQGNSNDEQPLNSYTAPAPAQGVVEHPGQACAQEAAQSVGRRPQGGDQGVGCDVLRVLGQLQGRLQGARIGGDENAACAKALKDKTYYFELH